MNKFQNKQGTKTELSLATELKFVWRKKSIEDSGKLLGQRLS
jgi:hypothetical protein